MPSTASLVNVGDQIKLSFAYHLVGAPTYRGVFSFGLYNSNGTPAVAGAASATTLNDTGYWASLSVTNGTPYPNSISEEKGGAAPLMGGSPTDSATLFFLNQGAGTSVTDANIYKVTYTLTLLQGGGTAGNNAVRLDVVETDNNDVVMTTFTGTDNGVTGGANQTVVPFTSFNEVGFRNQHQSIVYDNIKVEYIRVPEPATLALCGLGAAGLLMRRRQR